MGLNLGIGEHITTILRHWIKLILVIFTAVLVTGAIAFLSSKVYVAETRVLIMSRSPAARATSSSFTNEERNSSPQEQVLTQVEILKSPLLAIQLAEQLGPERVVAEMTWRWDWLRELPGKWKDQIILSLYGWDMTRDLILASGIKIPTLEKGPPGVQAAAEKLADNLLADAIVKTDMFGAAFKAPSGAFAAEAMNAYIKLYTDHVVALGSPIRTAEIAEAEVVRLERELREREGNLRAYVEQHGILSIEKQKDLLLDRRARVRDEQSTAQREQAEVIQKIAAIEEQIANLPAANDVSVTTVANPLVERLRERLGQLETEMRQLVRGSSSANKLNIEIEGVRAQLEKAETVVRGSETVGTSALFRQLQATLTQEKANQTAMDVRVRYLSQQLQEVQGELSRLDTLELRYLELKRTAEAKAEAYRFALQKREESAITEQLAENSFLAQVVQVEPASIPSRPAAPRRVRLLALGLIVGIMFGIGLAYLLEFARRTMMSRRETEIALGLPVLAQQQMSGLILRRKKANRTEIRGFASRLYHHLEPGQPRKLLFISDGRQSGQTTVIGAIADVLVERGADVLKVQIALSTRGGAEVQAKITGADGKPAREVGKLTQRDRAEPRKDLALLKGPSGKMHAALKSLIRERGRMYQVILIDSPDLERFPEALFIASMVDSVLPVVEAGVTRVDPALHVIHQFEDVQADVPGVILTKLRHSRSSWAFCWMAMMRLKSVDKERSIEAPI